MAKPNKEKIPPAAGVSSRSSSPYSPESYVPWRRGLYDEDSLVVWNERIDEEEADRILKSAGANGPKRLRQLDKALDNVAEIYWHASARPAKRWHAIQLRPALRIAERLQKAIADIPPSTRSALKFRVDRRSRSLGSGLEALDQCLAILISACKDFRGDSGRPTKDAITAGVGALMDVWSKYNGKKFPVTVRRAIVRKPDRSVEENAGGDNLEEAFWSEAAQFVYEVMQAIDPQIRSADIVGAIRRAASSRRSKVRKTRSE